MKIDRIEIQEVKDSRGDPTIAVAVFPRDAGGSAPSAPLITAVPSGKSRGSREAIVFAPGVAVQSVQQLIAAGILEQNFPDIRALDSWLLVYDPSPNKKKIGGNVALGISLSFAKAVAGAQGKELWQVLREEFFPETADGAAPCIFANLVNGGLHAGNPGTVQESMVLLEPYNKIREGIAALKDFYVSLLPKLEKKFGANIPMGDERGYAPHFKDSIVPLIILAEHIAATGLRAKIAVDVAASSFQKGDAYLFGGAEKSRQEMVDLYAAYTEKIPLLSSLEDPFGENDREGFRELRKRLSDCLVAGDDLVVSSPQLIEDAAREELINAAIIKPNQIGTVSETCAAIQVARRCGVREIISHRSGETDDVSIIHIARAANAYGVKIGAPAKERLLKYDELLRLYQ